MSDDPPLRFTTWLSPGLPPGQFATIAAQVSAGLGRTWTLTSEPLRSGPIYPEDDLFALDATDVGFLCAPSYLWLASRSPSSVSLVPVAPVYDDPRAGGAPVYFSDVVVRDDSGIEVLADLRGRRIGYNDRASLSGYVSLLARLVEQTHDPLSFADLREVGGHRRALELIAAGELDAAAVDANVRRGVEREGQMPARLRSVAALGPHPIQPIVVSAQVAGDLLGPLTEQLRRPELAQSLAPYGITAFAPVSHRDYHALTPLVASTFAPAATAPPPR